MARYQRALSKLRRLEEAGKCNIYYGDESGFCLRPCLPYRWQKKGQTLCLPAHSHSQRASAVCFVRRDGHQGALLTKERVGGDHFIAGVETLLPTRRAAVVVVNNASIHRCRKVREKRREWKKQGLRLLFLPPHSPHLNPVERLWLHVKYRCLEPAAYETFQNLCESLERVLNGIAQEQSFTFA